MLSYMDLRTNCLSSPMSRTVRDAPMLTMTTITRQSREERSLQRWPSCFQRKEQMAREASTRTVTVVRCIIVRTLFIWVVVFVILFRWCGRWSEVAIILERSCDIPFESSSASSSSSDSDEEAYASTNDSGRPELLV